MGRATARREFSKFQEIVNHGNFVIQTGLSRLKVSSGAGEGNESTIYEADSRALTSLFQPPFPVCEYLSAVRSFFPCLAQLQNALVNREAYVNYANERPGRTSGADGQLTIIRKINA